MLSGKLINAVSAEFRLNQWNVDPLTGKTLLDTAPDDLDLLRAIRFSKALHSFCFFHSLPLPLSSVWHIPPIPGSACGPST
jgi:hypothetical protein